MKKVVLFLESYSWLSKYKYLITMKMIMTLLLSFLFQVQAETIAHTVTIHKKGANIVDIFREIKKQTGYNVICSDAILEQTQKLDVNLKSVSMQTALHSILQSNGLSYEIENKNIIVQKNTKRYEKVELNISEVQQSVIKGSVKDSKGASLGGISISVKGTTDKTATNEQGSFEISAKIGDVLIFNSVGYGTKEVSVTNSSMLNVTLEVDESSLDEVVVVGFGTQKKASVVGAIQTIQAKELRIPSSNLSNAFAGRIAGVTSFQRSGEPGADGSTFYIRGISTFSGPTEPLIFIDGVEVTKKDMDALAPEVIEGFSVLKDATATALYGARGANGVMLITTKQGSEMEKAKINVRVENSFSEPTKMIKLANGVDYMIANNEALKTRGILAPRFSQEKIDATVQGLDPIIYPNVDWYKLLFKDRTLNQSANLNVTGGTKKVTYFLSASMNNDNGMLKNDPQNRFDNNIKQTRYSFQANIGAKLTNTTKVGLRINSQIVDYSGTASGTGTLYQWIFEAPPTLFPAYIPSNEDRTAFGNIKGGPHADLFRNPYAEMVKGYKDNSQSSVITSFDVEQNLSFLTEGLKVKGLISFKNHSSTDINRSFNPFYYQIDANNPINDDKTYNYNVITKGTTYLATSTGSSGDRLLNTQINLDYNRSFGLHDVSGMLVYLQRNYNNNAPSGFYASLPTRNQGIAGRVTYSYDNRYMAEANFGYNGSENFAEGRRFGFFPSVAIGYNIANESYFEPLKDVISNLKLRASYGLVGNSFTDPRFPYITDVNLSGKGYIFGDNWQTTMSGALVNKYGTENAKWETGKKINLGLDLDIFRGLGLVIDLFQETRSGIFMQRRVISAESGIVGNNPYANLGKVRNSGVDVSLGYNKTLSEDLTVSVRGTFTYNQNKLLDRDEPQLPYSYLSAIGKPLNRYVGLIAEGLYQDQADIDKSPQTTYTPTMVKPGDIKYKDLNGDGKIDNNDMMQIGNPNIPQVTYGFGSSIQYKKFDFGIFFQGITKVSLMMSNIHPFSASESVIFDWISKERWTESNPNPQALYPRLISKAEAGFNNYQPSTYWIRNGAFIRLKNAEIGYTYKKARLYLSGQNLLTFSSFKYWDPEQGGGNGLGYPPSRILNAGVQLNF